jgi:hypothetical protein
MAFFLQGPPGAVGEPGLPGEAGMKVRRDERREKCLVETSSQLATTSSHGGETGLSCAWDNGVSVLLTGQRSLAWPQECPASLESLPCTPASLLGQLPLSAGMIPSASQCWYLSLPAEKQAPIDTWAPG